MSGGLQGSTVSGKKWFVTFIDDHSRLCWIYLMSEKTEVEKILIDFYKMVENQFQTKISILHTDNGKEYFNKYLGHFLCEKGIQHQSTCIDTPQQNGIAERKNKHLLEVARAIMFSTNVPKYLWGEAVLTASFLINRMPTRILKYKTPLECFKQIFPQSRIHSELPLKVFGCTAYVHIPSKFRSKLDPRAEKCVFIGYAPNKKGYKCYNPQTKKIFISMDVIFLENQPFFQKHFLQGEKQESREENYFWDLSATPLPNILLDSPSDISNSTSDSQNKENVVQDYENNGNPCPLLSNTNDSQAGGETLQNHSNRETLVYTRRRLHHKSKNPPDKIGRASCRERV